LGRVLPEWLKRIAFLKLELCLKYTPRFHPRGLVQFLPNYNSRQIASEEAEVPVGSHRFQFFFNFSIRRAGFYRGVGVAVREGKGAYTTSEEFEVQIPRAVNAIVGESAAIFQGPPFPGGRLIPEMDACALQPHPASFVIYMWPGWQLAANTPFDGFDFVRGAGFDGYHTDDGFDLVRGAGFDSYRTEARASESKLERRS